MILDEIVRHKRTEVAIDKAKRPLAELETAVGAAGPVRPFAAALRAPPPPRVIAEIKRASPSAGPIRPGADPAAVAREYAAGGAAAISVLTDQAFFDGRLEFLALVRQAVELPILRKDFLVDPYQVVEARAAGADCVLLIVAALSPGLLADLMAQAGAVGLETLVEVHSETEAETAIAAGARLIGVNHRDLRTFAIDMGLTARLAPMLPAGTVLVAESGIRTPADLEVLARAGACAVLIGESLMRELSPGAALARLIGG